MKKKEVLRVIENYLVSKEKARVEQCLLASKGVGVSVTETLAELKDSYLKQILTSTEYGTLEDNTFSITDKGDVKLSDTVIDIFKYIDIVAYNYELVCNNTIALDEKYEPDMWLIQHCILIMQELSVRYLKTKSIKVKEIQFKSTYTNYNKYIHGLYEIDEDKVNMMRYTLLTKDFKFVHDYAKVLGKWLVNEYYYDEENDLIVTQDNEIIDIRYLTKKAYTAGWLFDLDGIFGEQSSTEIKEHNPLCIILQRE